MSGLYEQFTGKDYDCQDSWLGGVVFLQEQHSQWGFGATAEEQHAAELKLNESDSFGNNKQLRVL